MRKLDPNNVPVPLRPFIPIVQRWIRPGGDPLERLREAEADEQAMAELEAVSRSWSREQQEALDGWMEDGGRRCAFERNCFDSFLEFLDELDICPEPGNPDKVQECIDDLAEFGSQKEDSGRMWAARNLPDYGPAAMRAIPHLKDALSDLDMSVRIWAHYALALLDGDLERHRQAIESVGRPHGEQDKLIWLEVQEALSCLSRTPEQRALEAICGFCIRGDIENIRRLLPQADINGRDHNDGCPLHYAVGNSQVDVVELLLAHGARPDIRDKTDDAPLHDAASRRLGARMIELLVRYGADVNARNDKGQTPLDCALEYDSSANAALLRRLGGVEGAKLAT